MRIGSVVIVLALAVWIWQYIDQTVMAQSGKIILVDHPVMEDVLYEKNSASSIINSIRDAMKMNQLLDNIQLEAAAQNHADYLVANNEKSHFEIEGHKNFTGVAPLDRAVYAQYDALSVSENLSTSHNSARESVDGLMAAIYHRFGFLDSAIDEIGVGVAQDPNRSSNSAFVYLMGNSSLNDLCHEESFGGAGRYVYKVCRDHKHRVENKRFMRAKAYNQKSNPKITAYPYSGQNEIPPVFYDEDPDPLPDMEVSGFPISVEFNSYFYRQVSVVSFKLYRIEDNEEIAVRYMDKNSDPNNRFSEYQFAIFPLERLDYNSRYRAELLYAAGKEQETLSWEFSTFSIDEKLYVVKQLEQNINVRSGSTNVLYFKPIDSSDILSDIAYPHEVFVEFLDHNTLKVTLPYDYDRDFVIKAGKRKINISVN